MVNSLPVKKYMCLFALAFFLIFMPRITMAGTADGMCPLPESYKVAVDGVEQDNDMDSAVVKSRVTLAYTIMSYNEFVAWGIDPQKVKPIVLDEDDVKKYKFVATSASGSKALPGDFVKGDADSTTLNDWLKWMPREEKFHNLDWDKSPCQVQMNGKPCYTFVGHTDPEKGYIWLDNKGWQIEKIGFAYHMDSPSYFGTIGNIGYNPGESDGDKGKSEFSFAYYVPSVPAWYAASSVLTLTWSWPYKYQHKWMINHQPFLDVNEGVCKGCGLTYDEAVNKEQLSDLETPREWDTEARYCGGGLDNLPSDAKATMDWPPQNFLGDNFMVNGKPEGKSCIEEPSVAEARIGEGYSIGAPGDMMFYSNPAIHFQPKDSAAMVARITIYVTDKGNIAHVQTGFIDESKNLINAECGKTISESGSDKNLTIRIVDNAPWANKNMMEGYGSSDNIITNCVDGKWAEKNFKVRFWYEIPLYQYASYMADKWNDSAGIEKPLIEAAYSPIFVWKKLEWNSLNEFLFDGTDTKTLTYTYNHQEAEDLPIDPAYIVYEKNIPLSKLFIDSKTKKEEVFPLHYASTALGDSLGGPPYEGTQKNDALEFDFYDYNGARVIDKFASKPVKYTKGKGPLKYFVEARDGSLLTKGGGAEEEKFNCGDDSHFTEDNYLHPQLVYNPESVKYLVSSSAASGAVSPDSPVDPTAAGAFCMSAPYDTTVQNIWSQSPKLLNNINSNVDPGATVVQYFQAWGRVEPADTSRPNVGLKLVDTTTSLSREVMKINDIQTFSFYTELIENKDKKWSPLDNNNPKFNYPLFAGASSPRKPFSDDEELWEFKELDLLLKSSPLKRIHGGRSYVHEGDTIEDSLDPYGAAEDTQIEVTHQDLRGDGKKSSLAFYYAHDNIDGQRLIKNGNRVVKEKDWYKGVEAVEYNGGQDKAPVFVEDLLGKGYTSWKIIDKTFDDNSEVFKKIYMKGDYCKYPLIYFNNPNRNIDGSKPNDFEAEISLSYAVKDRAGNIRKLKLYVFVVPVETKINVIERKN